MFIMRNILGGYPGIFTATVVEERLSTGSHITRKLERCHQLKVIIAKIVTNASSLMLRLNV